MLALKPCSIARSTSRSVRSRNALSANSAKKLALAGSDERASYCPSGYLLINQALAGTDCETPDDEISLPATIETAHDRGGETLAKHASVPTD
jgi:hypothetical protein